MRSRFNYFLGVLVLTSVFPGAGWASDNLTVLQGTVYDRIRGTSVTVPNAKVVATDDVGNKVTFVTNGAGKFAAKLKPVWPKVYVTYYTETDVYGDETTYTQYNDNYVHFQTTAAGYYPNSSLYVDFDAKSDTLDKPLMLEYITNGNYAAALCKVNDNLFASVYPNGYGCYDNINHIVWGVTDNQLRTFPQAYDYCHSVPGLRLPSVAEMRKLKGPPNNFVTHFNFDATRTYWSGTVDKANVNAWDARLDNGSSAVKPYGTKNYVVCVYNI